MEVICNNCSASLEAEEDMYGQVLNCPQCDALVKIKPVNDYIVKKIPVTFGNMFFTDKFGFTGQGKVSLHFDGIVYIGKKYWDPAIIILIISVFVGLAFLMKTSSIFYMGVFLVMIGCHYDTKRVIPNETIKNVEKSGTKVTFTGVDTKSSMRKKGILLTENENDATLLFKDLSSRVS